MTTSTTPRTPSTETTALAAVVAAAQTLWEALRECPLPLRAVIGSERVSLQALKSGADDITRMQTVERIGALVGVEPGLVCEGIGYYYEAAGTVGGTPVHGCTLLSDITPGVDQ